MFFTFRRWDSQKNDSSIVANIKNILNYYSISTKIPCTHSYMFIHNTNTKRKKFFNLQVQDIKTPIYLQIELIILIKLFWHQAEKDSPSIPSFNFVQKEQLRSIENGQWKNLKIQELHNLGTLC